jgi:general stress protein 26
VKALSDEIMQFFHKQTFTVISTIDSKGFPHNSCKGIVKINKNGRIYLLDLYKAQTLENLKQNPHIAVTAIDEHRFVGYSLKGKAKIVKEGKLSSHIIRAWEKRITHRITQRVLKNIGSERSRSRHPEVLFPQPEYMIVMKVEEVVDLTPHHLK